MTETEARQFLVKYLAPHGYAVDRNESGAVSEGYPDLTISKNKQGFVLELKQGYESDGILRVAKFQPRQRGKQVIVALTQRVRILVVTPDKMGYLLSAPYQKIAVNARAVKWSGHLNKTCDLVQHLNDWMERS